MRTDCGPVFTWNLNAVHPATAIAKHPPGISTVGTAAAHICHSIGKNGFDGLAGHDQSAGDAVTVPTATRDGDVLWGFLQHAQYQASIWLHDSRWHVDHHLDGDMAIVVRHLSPELPHVGARFGNA